MSTNKVRFNLNGLDQIVAQTKGLRARVGILGSQEHQDDHLSGRGFKNTSRAQESAPLTNAQLMLIQIFGSFSRNIPPRDPLYQPLIRHKRELLRKVNSPALRAAFDAGDYKRMYALLGVAAEQIVQEAFETSGDGLWPPNSPDTIDAKGSAKPLIDTGQLRRAVSSDVVYSSGARKGGIVTAPIS